MPSMHSRSGLWSQPRSHSLGKAGSSPVGRDVELVDGIITAFCRSSVTTLFLRHFLLGGLRSSASQSVSQFGRSLHVRRSSQQARYGCSQTRDQCTWQVARYHFIKFNAVLEAKLLEFVVGSFVSELLFCCKCNSSANFSTQTLKRTELLGPAQAFEEFIPCEIDLCPVLWLARQHKRVSVRPP